LSGCGSSREIARSPVAKPAIQLTRDCEQLARTVDDPEITADTDPKLAVGEYVVALGDANDNISATRECQRRQRERLLKGK